MSCISCSLELDRKGNIEEPAEDESRGISLQDLPPEILQRILGHLDTEDLLSVSMVCRKLRTSTLEDPTLWKTVELWNVGVERAKLVSNCCPLLSDLKIHCPGSAEEILRLFLRYKDLELLNLKHSATVRMVSWIGDSFRS